LFARFIAERKAESILIITLMEVIVMCDASYRSTANYKLPRYHFSDQVLCTASHVVQTHIYDTALVVFTHTELRVEKLSKGV